MEVQEIMAALPTQAEEDLIEWARKNCPDNLGGEYMIYAAERVDVYPTMEMLMDNDIRRKKVWASRCFCTRCNDDFVTQKVKGADAIYLSYGEDGCTYVVEPEDRLKDLENIGSVSFTDLCHGDEVSCPFCGSEVKLISEKRIRGGRTKRIQVAQLQRIGEYAAIIYWLVSRRIDEFGMDDYDADPRDAFVLCEKGKILHFGIGRCDAYGNHHKSQKWELKRCNHDTWDKIYKDWGSIYDKKSGSAMYPKIPSLIGTTGEKTGLHSYWQQQCARPVSYLRLQKKYPNLENLVNAGHGDLVEDIVYSEAEGLYDHEAQMDEIIDRWKRKPHEMLRMTKEEYKRIEKRHITTEGLRALHLFRNQGFTDSSDRFLRYWSRDRGITTDKLKKAMCQTGDTSMDKYLRYMEKQGCQIHEIQLLIDCRRMTLRLTGQENMAVGGAPLTEEELWPRRLIATHDRLSGILAEETRKQKAAGYQKGFDQVLEKCAPLEWTDGELCIRIPRCNEDLVREGQILRHCVGGYGQSHSEGKNLIFFVRKHRRPERSYYTLNISMGINPYEIQLHGYGNERHGDRKQYVHKIPLKVRQFCDRWEKEVLRPYCLERYKDDNKEKSA